MNIINKTPHPIQVLDEKGEVLYIFPKSDELIRLKSSTVAMGTVNEIPITTTVFGEPEGLPEYSENTFYIVSQLVKSALPKRTDLLVPAEVVRDTEGRIVGCKSLGA